MVSWNRLLLKLSMWIRPSPSWYYLLGSIESDGALCGDSHLSHYKFCYLMSVEWWLTQISADCCWHSLLILSSLLYLLIILSPCIDLRFTSYGTHYELRHCLLLVDPRFSVTNLGHQLCLQVCKSYPYRLRQETQRQLLRSRQVKLRLPLVINQSSDSYCPQSPFLRP